MTERTPAGIAGFDEVTSGGVPRGRVTAAIGGLGTFEEPFDEAPARIIRNMAVDPLARGA